MTDCWKRFSVTNLQKRQKHRQHKWIQVWECCLIAVIKHKPCLFRTFVKAMSLKTKLLRTLYVVGVEPYKKHRRPCYNPCSKTTYKGAFLLCYLYPCIGK